MHWQALCFPCAFDGCAQRSVEVGARVARGCAGRLEESASLTRRIIRRDPIYASCVTSATAMCRSSARFDERAVVLDVLPDPVMQ